VRRDRRFETAQRRRPRQSGARERTGSVWWRYRLLPVAALGWCIRPRGSRGTRRV